ncbi:MAG: hypothetical protein DRQ44_18245 [Gammaproteobacteria bacterium]|nr:MAG: hypothetical protein DRQ44_18245 [Gammaproteobacteria bacterium]
MINNETRANEATTNEATALKSTSKKTSKIRKRRWAKRIHIRAAKIKKQLQIENNFHKAMGEIRTTTDRYRQSYLRWILNNMFGLFSYETGLQAIHDNSAYEKWLFANGEKNFSQRRRARRENTKLFQCLPER